MIDDILSDAEERMKKSLEALDVHIQACSMVFAVNTTEQKPP